MPAVKFTATLDMPLTDAQASAINKAIQSAVLQSIAKIDNGIIGRKIEIPDIRTNGIYLKNFKTLDALKVNAAFKKAALPK